MKGYTQEFFVYLILYQLLYKSYTLYFNHQILFITWISNPNKMIAVVFQSQRVFIF